MLINTFKRVCAQISHYKHEKKGKSLGKGVKWMKIAFWDLLACECSLLLSQERGTLPVCFQELSYSLSSRNSLILDNALINIAGFQGIQNLTFWCTFSFSSPSSLLFLLLLLPPLSLLFLLLLLNESFNGKLEELASHHLNFKSPS